VPDTKLRQNDFKLFLYHPFLVKNDLESEIEENFHAGTWNTTKITIIIYSSNNLLKFGHCSGFSRGVIKTT
jgi:hypothetical protein